MVLKNDQLAANAVPKPAPTIAGRTPAAILQHNSIANFDETISSPVAL